MNHISVKNELLIHIHLLHAKMSSTNPLHYIMDANRLTSSNFTDWLRNLKILLKSERIAYVLEELSVEEHI